MDVFGCSAILHNQHTFSYELSNAKAHNVRTQDLPSLNIRDELDQGDKLGIPLILCIVLLDTRGIGLAGGSTGPERSPAGDRLEKPAPIQD